MSQHQNKKNGVSGVILAGGQARRLGGQDKGLIEVCGQPMIAHSIRTFSPQVQSLAISANRNIDQYRTLGYTVIEDHFGRFEGPLAGLLRSLEATQTPLLATLPCDAPLAPSNFVERLHAHFVAGQTLAVIAHDGERLQPLFSLISRAALPSLNDYLTHGGRKVHEWVQSLAPVQVDFSDCADAFRNINTPEDLKIIREHLQCPA